MLQKSLLLHHVMMFALMLQGKPPYCLSLHRLKFFFFEQLCQQQRPVMWRNLWEKNISSRKIEWYNAWIGDLPHTAAVLELILWIALAAVSSYAAPGRVWQQCLRIAPKTSLACPALSDVTPGPFFRGKVERGKWIRRVWLSRGAARWGEEAGGILGGRVPRACSQTLRCTCVKAAETRYLAVWQMGKGRQMGMGTGVMVFSILIRG